MKKFLLTAAVLLAACSAADAQNKIYCEIVGASTSFFGNRSEVVINIDLGQLSTWRTDDTLVDENGEKIVFNSMVDAMNYMGSLGWDFEQAYVVSHGDSNVYHWLLSMVVEEGAEMPKLRTAEMVKQEQKAAKPKAPAASIVQDTDGTISSNADGTSLVASADGSYMLRLDSSRQVKIGSNWEEAETVIKNLYSMLSALKKDETGAVTCGGVQYTVRHKSVLGSESLVFVDIDENSSITKEALVQYLKDGRTWSSAQ